MSDTDKFKEYLLKVKKSSANTVESYLREPVFRLLLRLR